MEKINNLSQALAQVAELSAKSLSNEELSSLLKEQELIAQAVIYFLLEEKDLAEEKRSELEDQQGRDYFETISSYLNPSTTSFLIKPSLETYRQIRLSPINALQESAINYVAPSLVQVALGEKANLMLELIGEEQEIFFSNKELLAPSLMKELIRELNLEIKVLDTKTEMAIEYADEPIEVVLHVTTNALEWRLLPKIVKAQESFWEGVKNTLVNFSKNTITNPTFRKYAVVGLALGLAVSGADAMAASPGSDIDFDKAKEMFGLLDESLNQNFMPKFGFKGCNVSVDFAIDAADHLKTHVNLGNKQMVFDVVNETKGNASSMKTVTQVAVDILHYPQSKTGGCDMTSADLQALAKIITGKLTAFAGK